MCVRSGEAKKDAVVGRLVVKASAANNKLIARTWMLLKQECGATAMFTFFFCLGRNSDLLPPIFWVDDHNSKSRDSKPISGLTPEYYS